jgi:hypothetical protein
VKAEKRFLEEIAAMPKAILPLLFDDDDAALYRFHWILAVARRAIPEESEELRRLIFIGLESVIQQAIDAYDSGEEKKFSEFSDDIYAVLEEAVRMFKRLDGGALDQWRELYQTLSQDFDEGKAVWRDKTPFSQDDPEARLYQVMHWSEKYICLRLCDSPGNDEFRALPLVLLLGTRRLFKETLIAVYHQRGSREDADRLWSERSRLIWRAVCAFVLADIFSRKAK